MAIDGRDPQRIGAEMPDWAGPGAKALRFRHRAMACDFELYFYDERFNDAQQAAEAAFEEVDRLELLLSYFKPASNVSRLNVSPAGEPVVLHPDAFDCLALAKRVSEQTGGAYDPTVGVLLNHRAPWDFDEKETDERWEPPAVGDVPHVGMELIALNAELCAAARMTGGVRVDLGSIGKGAAIDAAAAVLRNWGVASAMLVAGRSTMMPIGLPPGRDAWRMRLRNPEDEATLIEAAKLTAGAISASSVVGDGHVLDPRTGEAVDGVCGAWAVAPSAAESDALATAFMVLDDDACDRTIGLRKNVGAFRVDRNGNTRAFGAWALMREDVGDS